MSGNGVASYGDLLVTSLLVLAAVCVAAFAVVRLFGRFLATGRPRGAHLLDVVARVPLEPRRSLYVVEVAGKTLLVGTSEMGLSVLSELDGGEVRARVVERPTFAELVTQAWTRRKERAAVQPDSMGGAAPDDGEESKSNAPAAPVASNRAASSTRTTRDLEASRPASDQASGASAATNEASPTTTATESPTINTGRREES